MLIPCSTFPLAEDLAERFSFQVLEEHRAARLAAQAADFANAHRARAPRSTAGARRPSGSRCRWTAYATSASSRAIGQGRPCRHSPHSRHSRARIKRHVDGHQIGPADDRLGQVLGQGDRRRRQTSVTSSRVPSLTNAWWTSRITSRMCRGWAGGRLAAVGVENQVDHLGPLADQLHAPPRGARRGRHADRPRPARGSPP